MTEMRTRRPLMATIPKCWLGAGSNTSLCVRQLHGDSSTGTAGLNHSQGLPNKGKSLSAINLLPHQILALQNPNALAGEMAKQIKVLAANTDALSSIPGTHTLERKNQLKQKVKLYTGNTHCICIRNIRNN